MSAISVSLAALSAVPGPKPGGAIAFRDWLIGPGSPYAISAFLQEHSFAWVVDPIGGLHAASPDTRVYLGYQPDNPAADTWTVAVTGTARQNGWKATFDRDFPVELVLNLLTTLVEHPGR